MICIITQEIFLKLANEESKEEHYSICWLHLQLPPSFPPMHKNK